MVWRGVGVGSIGSYKNASTCALLHQLLDVIGVTEDEMFRKE